MMLRKVNKAKLYNSEIDKRILNITKAFLRLRLRFLYHSFLFFQIIRSNSCTIFKQKALSMGMYGQMERRTTSHSEDRLRLPDLGGRMSLDAGKTTSLAVAGTGKDEMMMMMSILTTSA